MLIAEDEEDFSLWTLLRDRIESKSEIKILNKVTCSQRSIDNCMKELKDTARGIYLYNFQCSLRMI